MLGLSREGLDIARWAAANPGRVSCLYMDKAVTDFKSWPGGKLGVGKGSPSDWESLQTLYGFKTEAEAMAYKWNPIDLAAKLATEKVSAARRALDAGDLQALADATHALKSSAAGVGALHMFELASRIELLSRRGEREPLPQLLAELEAAHTRVQPSLDAARKNVAP